LLAASKLLQSLFFLLAAEEEVGDTPWPFLLAISTAQEEEEEEEAMATVRVNEKKEN
jgi:hypothetical protein